MNLTQDQIRQLTLEQQETLASIVVQDAEKRQRLLKKAGPYFGKAWFHGLVPGAIMVFTLAPGFFTNQIYHALAVTLSIMCPAGILFILITYHAVRINRRLDALIELLGADKKTENHSA